MKFLNSAIHGFERETWRRETPTIHEKDGDHPEPNQTENPGSSVRRLNLKFARVDGRRISFPAFPDNLYSISDLPSRVRVVEQMPSGDHVAAASSPRGLAAYCLQSAEWTAF